MGTYYDRNGGEHGFLDTNGAFTTLDDPNATTGTWLTGINNSGQILGDYRGSAGVSAFVATEDTPAVPEPGSFGLIGLGLSVLFFAGLRRAGPQAS